ncbi:MAG: hypothetical protein LBB21_06115 [Holosporaceae bacterium]|jgi:hypothetical protein|nr:hypothetical protein [Holosporaceae bacterium]
MVLRKGIIMSVLACSFLFGAQADQEANNDVHSNYWSVRINKDRDGPANVETEESTFKGDKVVKHEKNVGILEQDEYGRLRFKKAQTPPAQGQRLRQETENQTETRAARCPKRCFDDPECCNTDRRNADQSDVSWRSNAGRQSLIQEINKELSGIKELIEQGTVDDEFDQKEIYYFVKKRLHKIKKLAKVLFGDEDFDSQKKRKWFDLIKF